jgi:ribosomal protein L11 methyltransferase
MISEQKQWHHEVSVPVQSGDVDAVSNYIIENISSGLLLEDEDGASETIIRFYVAGDIDLDEKLEGLKIYLNDIDAADAADRLMCRKICNLDWIEAYKKSVEPVMLGQNIVIKAPWHETSFPGKTEIILEPKMAFGTGRHETTRGCLAALESLNLSGATVLDLGCGSGVLGIYAALRGAKEVFGYDIDPLAVENSRENYVINGVANRCTAYEGDIDFVPADRQFDVIVVNIIKEVILPILGKIKAHAEQGGTIILSGLLYQDQGEIEAALHANDIGAYRIAHDNEWITFSIHNV